MPDKIFYRLRQFLAGMFSAYTPRDEEFVRSVLSIQEKALFDQLPGFEKKHAVRVARRMVKKVRGKYDLDERKMARLGLLHDIGKIAEHNSIATKSLLVIFRFFFPAAYHCLAEKGRDAPFFKKWYIHKHHGAVGAELLAKMGETSEILSVIAKHDPRVEPFAPGDPVELKILQEADIY